jgi:hypothetical protein
MNKFTIKVFRGGVRTATRIEFYSTLNPIVVNLRTSDDHVSKIHKVFIDKGAVQAVEVMVNYKFDHIYLFPGDQMFIENETGTTVYNSKQV